MNFEQYAPQGNDFVNEVARELGNPNDTNHAYRVMKSVFHTLRDVLTPEESLHLISQFPLPIKGVYVDGWHVPAREKIRSLPEFIDCMRRKDSPTAGRDFGNDETAKHHAKAVLNIVKRRVAAGEVQHMIDQFPMELTELWLPEKQDSTKQ